MPKKATIFRFIIRLPPWIFEFEGDKERAETFPSVLSASDDFSAAAKETLPRKIAESFSSHLLSKLDPALGSSKNKEPDFPCPFMSHGNPVPILAFGNPAIPGICSRKSTLNL